MDGAEKNQEGITAANPLQDGAEGADLDGVEKIMRKLQTRSPLQRFEFKYIPPKNFPLRGN